MSEEDEKRFTQADYLCYHLWSRLSSEQDRDITKTQFWKLVCIAERNLEEQQDYSTGLPRYWYQYGEIPNMDQLGIESVLEIEYADGQSHQAVEVAEEIPDSAFDLGGQAKWWIDRVVSRVVREFSYSSSWKIKQHHYENHAPHEFIQVFDDFREEVRTYEPNQASLGRFTSGGDGTTHLDNLKDQLDDLVRLYPDEKYGEMHSLFLRWEDTMGMLLDQGKVSEASDLTHSFWKALSRVELRIHHNHNVAPSQIEEWKRKRDVGKNEFRQELRDVRDGALEDRDSTSGEVESMAESLSETLRNTF